jgi:hypothetical protein
LLKSILLPAGSKLSLIGATASLVCHIPSIMVAETAMKKSNDERRGYSLVSECL